jgi:hypothetical protein
MAVSIDSTVGGANANAYCTRAEANAYVDSLPSARQAAWLAAADPDKDRAIVTATRLLDEHVEWAGAIATLNQALSWPRGGMFDRDGRYIQIEIVPQELKNAVAEFARQLIAADRTADSGTETQGIASLIAGPVALTFNGRGGAKVVPDAVFYMVQQWGRIRSRKGDALAVPLERA